MNKAMTQPPCMTVRQVAERLSVDPTTVTRMIREGHLPALRLPRGGYRIDRGTLERMIQEWRVQGTSNQDTASEGSAPESGTSSGPRTVKLDGYRRAKTAKKTRNSS